MTVVYCYRNGQIRFGKRIPKGALLIVKGKNGRKIRETIAGCARLAYDEKNFLVPGVPEAKNSLQAIDALNRFVGQMKKRLQPSRATLHAPRFTRPS